MDIKYVAAQVLDSMSLLPEETARADQLLQERGVRRRQPLHIQQAMVSEGVQAKEDVLPTGLLGENGSQGDLECRGARPPGLHIIFIPQEGQHLFDGPRQASDLTV